MKVKSHHDIVAFSIRILLFLKTLTYIFVISHLVSSYLHRKVLYSYPFLVGYINNEML